MDEMETEYLKSAIKNGDLDKVNSYLKNCSPQYINTLIFDENSPLHYAIQFLRRYQVFLKQFECDGNCKSLSDQDSSLVMSSRNKRDEIILSLINAGANLNSEETEYSMTPLMSALENRCGCDVLNRLIDDGSEINAQSTLQKTPLVYAIASKCCKKIIRKLINLGSDINNRDIYGWTPLFYAVIFSKDLEIVHMLINAGANLNAVDEMGQNLLMIMHYGHRYCYDKYCNNREIIDALFTHGTDVKFVNFKGNSVLHKSDCKYLIEIAVKCGVSVNLKNNNGKTALEKATFNNQLEKVKKLLSLGADPNCTDLDLNTPLHSLHDDDDIIAFLVYYGGSLNCLNARHQTPMDTILDGDSYDLKFRESGISAFFKHFLLFVNEHGYREDCYFFKLVDFVTKNYNSLKMKCEEELRRMRRTFISDNLTFYQFCNLKRLHTSEIVDISVKNYNYSNEQIKNLFPVYQNIIILRIKDNQVARLNWLMRKYLERIVVRPLTIDQGDSDVTLIYDCMYDICKFLNRQQIFNLLRSSFI